MLMAKKKKRSNSRITLALSIIVGILLILVVLMFLLFMSERNKNRTLEEQSRAVSELLKTSPGVKGRSCGVLHAEKAAEIIGSNSIEQRFTNEPVDNQVNTQLGGIHWVDSCRYVDARNSAQYVELFIETFETENDAETELLHDLPKVSIEEVESGNYDRLFYSAGAWFALKDRIVIKVSANSGGLIDIQQKSRTVFDNLATLIE